MHEYQTPVILRDGTPIMIRSVRPDDKQGIQEGFCRLSPKSRYQRFMSHIGKLSDRTLKYLTEIDNVNHVAICAIDMSGDEAHGVGIARYIRLEDEPDVAEFAIAIIDEFQNRGLGTLLLNLLIDSAIKNHITGFRAFVLIENTAMKKILNRFGAKNRVEDNTTIRYDLCFTQIREYNQSMSLH